MLRKKNYRKKSDEELMKVIISHTNNQRQLAFDCLYERYAQQLLEYFIYMLNKDENKAQDFLQDIFLKIIENPRQFNCNYKLRSWLFSVAANMCKNEYRKQKVRYQYQKLQALNSIEQPDLLQQDEKKIMRNAIFELDAKHRTVIVLRHKFNFSIKEIAKIVECNEGTVKSRLFNATKKLSDTIKKYYEPVNN